MARFHENQSATRLCDVVESFPSVGTEKSLAAEDDADDDDVCLDKTYWLNNILMVQGRYMNNRSSPVFHKDH